NRFARLAVLLRAAAPTDVHLVLPASMSESAQFRAADVFRPFHLTRVAFTKLDELVGYGVILNVIDRLGLTPAYFFSGQNVPRDLEFACGAALADLVFPRRGHPEFVPGGST